MEQKLTVVKNLGMYLVVDYEYYEYTEDKEGNMHCFLHAGLKVVGNPYHRNFNEMWEWDRIDREEWDATFGKVWEEIRYANLPKRKKDEKLPVYPKGYYRY